MPSACVLRGTIVEGELAGDAAHDQGGELQREADALFQDGRLGADAARQAAATSSPGARLAWPLPS